MSAILLIDFQPYNKTIINNKMIRNIRLIQKYAFVPVIWVYSSYLRKTENDSIILDKFDKKKLVHGIQKHHESAFNQTNLIKLLNTFDVNTLFIGGIDLNGSLNKTFNDAKSNGYCVSLIKDISNIDNIQNLGNVQFTEDIIADPEFIIIAPKQFNQFNILKSFISKLNLNCQLDKNYDSEANKDNKDNNFKIIHKNKVSYVNTLEDLIYFISM